MIVRRSEKGVEGKHGSGADVDGVLWAKYLDYCSAQVCDIFMGLEEERVFELARAAEEEAGLEQGELSFRGIAKLLVEKMRGDLSLPDFEVWAAAYHEDPERYESQLLGLWKRRVEPARSS
ncbi:MAG: hypothetical protein V3U63_05305 [Gemmatimonadota bacterium]